MERIVSAIPYFYGSTPQGPNTARISIQMMDSVEGEILTDAVKESKERYPYFCVKTENTGKDICLMPNEKEILVREGDDPPALGTEETNFHLLAFSWKEDWIYLDFFHGIADGTGIFRMLRTVLYYYCKGKYDASLSPGNIHLKGETIPREEIEEPYPEAVDPSLKTIGKAERKESLNLAAQGLCTPGNPVEYRIRIPERAFMRFSKSNDGSPATVTALLLSRAIDRLHSDAGKAIICGMAMDIRNVLGKPLAHHSLVTQLFLEYKDSIKKMDTERQAMCFRGMVMVQGQDENIMDSVRNNMRLFEKMETMPDVQSKRQLMQRVVAGFLDTGTFKVSYVGKSGMEEAEKYIKGIYSSIDLNGSGIMVEVNAVNGQFCFSFLQEWPEDVYFKAFLRELEKEEIPYEWDDAIPAAVSAVSIVQS